MQAAFWIAVACGAISALTGNRTAWALLASVAMCIGLDHFAVPFNFVLWILIDLVVILFIIRPTMTATDCVILALFVPAWVFYLLPPEPRFLGGFVVVVMQLLLTFPADVICGAVSRYRAERPDDPFDKMVLA